MNLISVNSSLLAFSKEGIRHVAIDMVNQVHEGKVSAIDALVYVKKAAELFAEAEKNLRPLAESQYHLAKGEKQVLHSVEITEAETGVKYDYTACQDLVWDDLNEKLQSIVKRMKEREEFLKIVRTPTLWADINTGEAYTIQPPIRSGKLGLKLSIK